MFFVVSTTRGLNSVMVKVTPFKVTECFLAAERMMRLSSKGTGLRLRHLEVNLTGGVESDVCERCGFDVETPESELSGELSDFESLFRGFLKTYWLDNLNGALVDHPIDNILLHGYSLDQRLLFDDVRVKPRLSG